MELLSLVGNFKEAYKEYPYAETLQTISLVLFVIFFVGLVTYVMTRPKNYYEKDSEMPFEDGNIYDNSNLN